MASSEFMNLKCYEAASERFQLTDNNTMVHKWSTQQDVAADDLFDQPDIDWLPGSTPPIAIEAHSSSLWAVSFPIPLSISSRRSPSAGQSIVTGMSVHISPATRDAWSYAGHGDFYVEASGNRHRRATIPELKAVYKGSDGSRDPPGHWYEAQLIHYGLQPSKTKGTAKMRLFDALNKGSLSVPAHILKVEGDLKKDWNKREREAKQATKSAPAVATSSKGSRKRKADDAQINASYETVDITLGVSVSRRRGEIRVMPANAAPKKAKTTATGSGGKLAKPAKAASKGKGSTKEQLPRLFPPQSRPKKQIR